MGQWREYLDSDNPVIAALLGCMEYNRQERVRIKVEFLKMMLRQQVILARMQLLTGFLESYLGLSSQEEEEVRQILVQELPTEEVREVEEILTSYHLRGREEGREEGIQALQKLC